MLNRFMQAVAGEACRLTYAGLSRVYRYLEGEVPEAANNGQHGVWVVREALQAHLQPHVCRVDGSYADDAIANWQVQGVAVPTGLGAMPVIPAEDAVAAYEHWAAAQAEGAE